MGSQDALTRHAERQEMVQRQLVARGIRDPRTLAALTHVQREAFMAEGQDDAAYGDHACPIGCGQTISQPYTVAFMVESAGIRASDRVLEIGTGSGYGAAVLSRVAREVHSVERIPQLVVSSAIRLRRFGYTNVQVHQADGTLGLASHAPYDVIIVTAGARKLPPTYVEQLTDGGRIVIPIGETSRRQRMCRFTLRGTELHAEDLGAFVFVPLVGPCGWSD